MASHEFHNGNRLLLVHRRIQRNLPYGSCHILRRTAVARRVIGLNQVIINGLRNTDKPNVASVMGRIAGKLADRIHGIIAADVQEIANLHPAEFFKDRLIESIRQALRKLVTAGPQVCRRGQL